MLITNSVFSAKHDLDYKTPLYLIIFENEPGGYCNHMVAGVDAIESLNFDTQDGSFNPTNTKTGAISSATATILSVTDDGTTGILYLTDVVGTFQDNEIIYESTYGGELLTNGNFTAWTGDNPDSWTLTATEDGNNYVTENPAGQAQIVSDAVGRTGVYQIIPTVGSFYVYSVDIKTVTSGTIQLTDFGALIIGGINSTGVKTGVWQAQGTFFGINDEGTACDITVDDVSVKQITNAALANGTLREIYLEGWKNF